MKVLIAGCGWLGRALGRSLIDDGHAAVGVRRDPEACRALAALGIEPLVLDLCAAGAEARLPEDVDAVVACQSAGYPDAEAYRRAYVEATRPLLDLARHRGVRLVWVGSTGVFGQSDGADVDEATAVRPVGPTAEVLVEAERAVLTSRAAACIVRLSGLYGPERYGVIDRVRDGVTGLGPGDDAWMNFCHRDDAVRVVRALIEHGRPGAVYHGSDAEPTRRRDVVRYICDRLGIEPATGRAGRRPTNRRIDSRATRAELGLSLAYPTFRDGLAPVL